MTVTPLVTAVIGAVVVLAGALVARSATRYAAGLEAAQRRRDAELISLREFRDVLIEVLARVSAYRYALTRVARDTPAADRPEAANQFLETIKGYGGFRVSIAEEMERLRNLARCLPWPDLREAFDPLDRILLEAARPRDAALRIDEDAMLLENFVDRLADRHRQLVASYPTQP
ncbi:hypothetical protein EUA04_02460 [Mycolicibacterium obuense]|uniref:Uncharacterized protein n=1 Tax=Mycolicibacterium obuense TaxID=1807 RepID=A0A4R5XB77_9MYCO|nr:hypothetical protein [Mycolicibacterium obuense]TDL11864.1 hypothetical protein EUA04_02460 [Mycolicibacterium obuense]